MVKSMAMVYQGVVVNIIVYDTEGNFVPEQGYTLVDIGPNCEIGAIYAKGVFTKPANP